MKKDIGVHSYLFPMPVFMVATYNEDNTVNVMNMAWGGICANNMVALNIDEGHKTAQNIKEMQAFTISIADIQHVKEADFFGIVSGNKVADKFERSGLHAVKSNKVDAPVIEEFPLALECRVVDIQSSNGFRVVGEIINTLVDEEVIGENGKIDPLRLNTFVFDTFQGGYYAIGEKIGQAWNSGADFAK